MSSTSTEGCTKPAWHDVATRAATSGSEFATPNNFIATETDPKKSGNYSTALDVDYLPDTLRIVSSISAKRSSIETSSPEAF